MASLEPSPTALSLKYTGSSGDELTRGCARNEFRNVVSCRLRFSRESCFRFEKYFLGGNYGMPSLLDSVRTTCSWNDLIEE
jgi:hypothetical protein